MVETFLMFAVCWTAATLVFITLLSHSESGDGEIPAHVVALLHAHKAIPDGVIPYRTVCYAGK